MKDKDKSSQKKSTGSSGARSAKRTGSGGNAPIPAGRPAQIEARFRAIFESSRDAIGVSKAGIHIFVNPAYLDLFGFPAGTDLAGKTVLDLIAPESRDQVKAYILRRVRGELVPTTYETRGRRTDGSEFDMEVNVSLYQESGEDHTLVILSDITERKRAEEEIAERGAMLRQIMDTASVAIGLVDKTGRITHANRRMAEMFGRTLEELAGREYVELVHPSERAAGRKNMLALLESEIPSVDLERLYWRKDGTEFWGHLACRRFHDVHGNKLGLIGVITDISLRKQSELALKQSEAKYRRLYNETPVMLHSVDRDGILIDINDYWIKTMGYARSEVIGRKVTDFYTDASRKYAQDIVQPAFFRTGIANAISYQFVKKNGEVLDVLLSATAERDDAGNVVRSQAVIQDITERKRMEEYLRRSEERYRDLFENASDGISIQDGTGFIDCNKRGAAMYGLPKEKLIGRSPAEFAPERQPDGRLSAEVAGEKIQAALSGVPQFFEWQPLRADGSPFDVEITLSRLEIGGSVFLQAIVRDITARKRAEDERRRSERMLQTIIDAEPECVKLLDENANLIMMNRAGLDMLQADSLEQVKGRCVCSLLTSGYRQAFLDLTRRVFQGGSGTLLFEVIGMKGRHLWLETHAVPLRNEKDEIGALLGVTRNVTERIQQDEALRASEARFRSIIEHASTGILVADNETAQIMYANPEICRLLGYSEQEFHTMKATELAVPEEASLTVVGFQAHAAGKLHATERTIRRKDGSSLRMSINSVQMEYDGRPSMAGFFVDISEKVLLEEERLKTQKLESLGTLAGGIAHDFNNLLQGVFGYISMARLTFDQKEKSLAMLEQAEKALHQSVNLTSQLLTFSKGGKPVKKVLDLRSVIENSTAFALSGSRVTCEILADKDLRTVEADEGQIGQVIQNIVLNADQAMPLGGMIRVSIRNMPAAAIVLPADLQGDLVEIVIRDQGTGIPAEHLTRIFDPYFTTKEKGSGLGLATAYSIIKNHGGLVRVQSEVGKGTTFFIYLPASGAAVEESKSPAIPAATRKARILVMDDEKMIRAVAGELLTAIGHDVTCAESGETALEAYQAARDAGTPFDLVILDLTIRGGMGGIETLRKLTEINRDVKAVVSSGYSDDAALSNYRKQGFRAFLKKPYNMEDLQSTLNALLA